MLKAAAKFVQKIKADARTAELIDGEMPELALMFEARAKDRTPVVTGRLKSGMVGRRSGFLKAELANPVEYAVHVEFGTSRMAPRAMIRNAAQQMVADGLAYLKQKLNPTRL